MEHPNWLLLAAERGEVPRSSLAAITCTSYAADARARGEDRLAASWQVAAHAYREVQRLQYKRGSSMMALILVSIVGASALFKLLTLLAPAAP
jgi:hypothetical protein